MPTIKLITTLMHYVVFLAGILAPVFGERMDPSWQDAPEAFVVAAFGSATDDANPAASWIDDVRSLPLCAALPLTSRLYLRTAGRRTRDANLDFSPAQAANGECRGGRRWLLVPKWALAALFSLVMLLAATPATAMASQRGATAGPASQYAAEADSEPDAGDHAANGTQVQPVAHRRSKTQREGPGEAGNGSSRRPYFGMPNVVVNDPADYPRPPCLENNDPGSFFYSMRPNILNVPVPDEWDFYNIINTDRPDFTDAVYSVGKGVTYLETGFTYTKINTFDAHINTRQVPESLLRYGLTDEFELRLKWPGYLMENLIDPHSALRQSSFGSEDIDTAFKWELLQQRGWRPMTTLVAGATLPTGGPGTSANFVQPHFNILFGWGIRRWLYIKQQVGCDFVHSSSTQVVTPLAGAATPTFIAVRSPPNSWHESISILTQWSKRVGAFHEWFMISGTGGGDTRAQHFLDMGLYLYATPNVQFDVRVGRQLSDRVDYYFTGAGFSGRW